MGDNGSAAATLQTAFALQLTALQEDRYRIDASVAREEFIAYAKDPFGDREVNTLRDILSRQSDHTSVEASRVARLFGQKLFTFVIRDHPQIYAAYRAWMETGNGHFQLSLANAGALADLPWELLRDPERDFLALSTSTPIVRTLTEMGDCKPVSLVLPLRVLIMVSAAGKAASQAAEIEWMRLQQATAELQSSGLLRLDRVERASFRHLRRAILADDYLVFHFIGNFNRSGAMLLADDHDEAQPVSANELNRELYPESTLRLVVLTPHAPISLTSALFASHLRLPAVISAQFPISDQALFTTSVYRALAAGLPLYTAVGDGRRALANLAPGSDWAAPILLLRPNSGGLFRLVSNHRAT